MRTIIVTLLAIGFLGAGCKKGCDANGTLIGKTFNYTATGTGMQVFETNIFTPNGDGRNDIFSPVYPGSYNDSLSSDTLKIYCESDIITITSFRGWDGSGSNEGIYRYEASFQMHNGGSAMASGFFRLVRTAKVPCGEKALFRFPQAYSFFGSATSYDTGSVSYENLACQ